VEVEVFPLILESRLSPLFSEATVAESEEIDLEGAELGMIDWEKELPLTSFKKTIGTYNPLQINERRRDER
jgi:hypothetical protein